MVQAQRRLGLRVEQVTPALAERYGLAIEEGVLVTGVARGTGLGLTIVNHILAAHGGKLEVRSQPGRGSTFTAWIPAAQADRAAG